MKIISYAVLSSAVCLAWLAGGAAVLADPPLHEQIDALVEQAHPGPWAPPADDAEFLRRVYLDLAGNIPPADVARSFLADTAADKRAGLVDRLLAAPELADRLADAFSVMLLERRGTGAIAQDEWRRYLRAAFRAGKPWDQIAREILSADGLETESRPAMAFFLSRGATSYDNLTRDIGRLFLGMDLQCAHCHDHPSIKDYKQADYYGIYAFLKNTNTAEAIGNKEVLLVQKGLVDPVEFKSVFTGESAKTGPQLPGRPAVEVPTFAKPEEAYEEHPRIGKLGTPKFNVREKLAAELASKDNPQFARNVANRVWAMAMGRGLVEPLDLQHADNPPSNPALLDLLTQQMVAMQFDLRQFLRELVLSRTYQRASVLPQKGAPPAPQTFSVANMKGLSAEQLMSSLMRAAGQTEIVLNGIDDELKAADAAKFATLQADPAALEQAREPKLAELRGRFVAAFANPPGEPEDDFSPTLSGALFFVNDEMLAGWLKPQPGNLVDRLSKIEDAGAAVDELYMSVLTRSPSEDERAAALTYLEEQSSRRAEALGEIAWGLLASTEFRLNH